MSLTGSMPPAGPVQQIPLGPQGYTWLISRYDDAKRACSTRGDFRT